MDCGCIIRHDDAYYIDEDDYDARCYSCHCKCNERTIHDYYFKPEPVFYGTGSRYFGVELEVDDAGENNNNAAKITAISNRLEEHIYIKHDGSLNEGFEIVTHPMTLDYHLTQMPWSEILNKAKELGYLSHQAGTCGLHVHINRTAFGETVFEKSLIILADKCFQEDHNNETEKILEPHIHFHLPDVQHKSQ